MVLPDSFGVLFLSPEKPSPRLFCSLFPGRNVDSQRGQESVRVMPFYCGKRSAGICVVLGTKKSSTYPSEYASGFFEPVASHLPAFLCLATKDDSDRLLNTGFSNPA